MYLPHSHNGWDKGDGMTHVRQLFLIEHSGKSTIDEDNERVYPLNPRNHEKQVKELTSSTDLQYAWDDYEKSIIKKKKKVRKKTL